ncbi:protein EMBRYONIC FLOWER 1 [Solanum verrucosum]|uniref:protein EMBRYONIC FLOWER 1 n=1 Tax=Solanum verrucosum TaxID=315347 RepID=UPI0020D1BC56|nr:protein EMBRYONIC FLOWER 1 [Solanum verrucosum]
MEKSNKEVEENNHKSDTNTPVPKALGSFIQIESISIDLDIPMPKKEEGKCQHYFSIRGYVAEKREKDRRICAPFTSSGDRSISEEQLPPPPLDVPKFRWWRCKNCMREIGTESSGEEIEILPPSCRSRLISPDMVSSRNATTNALLEMKHDSISRKVDKKKAIIVDAANTSGYDFLCKPYKGRCTMVEDKSVSAGNRTGSGNVRNEEIRYPTIEVAISKHCSSKEIDRKSPAANLSNNVIRVASSESTLSEGKIVPHGNLYISADDVSPDIGAETAMGSPNDVQRTASTAFKQSDVPDTTDKALETSKTKLSRLPSIELRDHNGISPGSDPLMAKNRQFDSHNDVPNDVPRRKTRKVRLLTDILGGKVNLESNPAKADRNSLSTKTVVPPELEPVGMPKDKRYFQKKRKIPQEVDSNLSGMGIQCNIGKRVRPSNGGVERSSIAVETADSRSDEKESGEEGIPNGNKNLRIKHRNGINKKKNKQFRPVDGYSPEMRWQDIAMENGGLKGYGDVNSLVHPVQHSSMGGKFEPHLSSYQSLVGTGRGSGLCWKSSKFPEVGRVPSTLMHPNNNFPGESSTRRNHLIPVTSGIEMMTFQPARELSAKVGLDLSLNSFRDPDKHAGNDITQSKNMTNWPFILQKGSNGDIPRRKDNSYVRQSNVPEAGQSSRKEVIYDLNQGVPQTASMWKDIQSSPILLQKGNLQVSEIMETPRQHNKENLNEFLEHSEAIKHRRCQHSEKTLERGLSDDIPMEIVELMAKNQYERGLTETRTKCMSERTAGFARPYTEIHESEAVALSRGVPSFRPANVNKKIDVGASRGSSLQTSHVKRNHLGMERPPTKLFGTSPQTQQKFPSGGQGSASVHIRPGEGAKPVWFPTVQNMQPLRFGIPQKSIGQPNDKMIHGQAPASLQKGRTISDIKCSDVRMQNEHHGLFHKSDSNVKGMGSLDPYCNETIPAMQLLSLMDRRMPSTPPFNLDANKLLEKPFSPCSYHPRFHIDGKQSILNGSYLSHHPLKEAPGVHPGGYYADQISFKPRGQEKSRKSYAPSQCGGSKLQSFVSSSGPLTMTRDPCLDKDGQKRNQGASSSQMPPQQDRNTSKFFNLEGHTAARAVPVKSNCETLVCSLNQNPAEFSVPEEGNPFTRTIKDTRIGKSSSRERSRNVDLNNKRKQRKVVKESAGRLPPSGRAL